MNKILFGGSFDPIHKGHINMALEASRQLDADVIFLPSKIAIWKKDSTDIKHKINMINIAINSYPRLYVDLYEVNSDSEYNYSIDTVKHFINEYPNDTFYYLIGVDHVNAFHKWKDALELSKLAHIIFFDRPGYEIDEDNVKKYHMQRIVGPLVDASSSDIRNLKSLALDKEIIKYIVDNDLYFIPKVRSYLKEKRFLHSVSVAFLALDIALRIDESLGERAFIAGLLHDIGKETPLDKSLEIMNEHFKEYKDMPRFSFHQFVGAFIAEKEFDIHEKEILEAIEYHATGNENMSLLGKIIYASDKIEPTRGFDSKELIESMMVDPIEGFITVLKANKEFLEENRGDINNPLTSKCFKCYL